MSERTRAMRRGAMLVAFLTVAFGLPWLTHSEWGAVVLMLALLALGVYGLRMARHDGR